jgi:rhodanese-related sulfurtransferase
VPAATADRDATISAIELAEWLRAGQPRLRIFDIRSQAEYRAYHIPGAEPVAAGVTAIALFPDHEVIVLYDESGIADPEAWQHLRGLESRRVVILRHGLHGWLDQVMSPTISAEAPADAKAAFERAAALSRYFGGTPRTVGTAGFVPEAALVGRRGC